MVQGPGTIHPSAHRIAEILEFPHADSGNSVHLPIKLLDVPPQTTLSPFGLPLNPGKSRERVYHSVIPVGQVPQFQDSFTSFANSPAWQKEEVLDLGLGLAQQLLTLSQNQDWHSSPISGAVKDLWQGLQVMLKYPPSSLRLMPSLLGAYQFLIDGNVDGAWERLDAICQQEFSALGSGDLEAGYHEFLQVVEGESSRILPKGLSEAYNLYDQITQDKIRHANLKLLEFWHADAMEQKIIQQDAAGGLLGYLELGITKLQGQPTPRERVDFEFDTDISLINEVKGLIESGKVLSVQEGLFRISKEVEKPISERAQEILRDLSIDGHREGLLLAHAIGYFSQYPPKEKEGQNLLLAARSREVQEFRTTTAGILYQLIRHWDREEPVREQARHFMRTLEEPKGVLDYASALVQSTTIDQLGLELLILKGAITLGQVYKLKTMAQLGKRGIQGRKAMALATAAEIGTEVSALWAFQSAEAALNHDLSRVLAPKHLARSYGATLIMILGIKGAMGSVQALAPSGLGALGLRSLSGELSARGQFAASAWGHGAGLGSVTGTALLNQQLGLSDEPKGGWKETVVHSAYTYLKYALALKAVAWALKPQKPIKERAEPTLAEKTWWSKKIPAGPRPDYLLAPLNILLGGMGFGLPPSGKGGRSYPQGRQAIQQEIENLSRDLQNPSTRVEENLDLMNRILKLDRSVFELKDADLTKNYLEFLEKDFSGKHLAHFSTLDVKNLVEPLGQITFENLHKFYLTTAILEGVRQFHPSRYTREKAQQGMRDLVARQGDGQIRLMVARFNEDPMHSGYLYYLLEEAALSHPELEVRSLAQRRLETLQKMAERRSSKR